MVVFIHSRVRSFGNKALTCGEIAKSGDVAEFMNETFTLEQRYKCFVKDVLRLLRERQINHVNQLNLGHSKFL